MVLSTGTFKSFRLREVFFARQCTFERDFTVDRLPHLDVYSSYCYKTVFWDWDQFTPYSIMNFLFQYCKEFLHNWIHFLISIWLCILYLMIDPQLNCAHISIIYSKLYMLKWCGWSEQTWMYDFVFGILEYQWMRYFLCSVIQKMKYAYIKKGISHFLY